MIKVNRTNLRVFIFVILFAAACSFAIGVSTSIKEISQELYARKSFNTSILPNQGSQTAGSYISPNGHIGADGETGSIEGERQTIVFSAPSKFQGKTLKEVKLSDENKVIALTFDDGPWPKYSHQILEILKKNDIKATFFWIGKNVKNFPEIAKETVAAGHAIANHTWSHSYRMMNKTVSAREIDDTAAIIEETTGVKTALFRPPGGLLKNGPASYALSKNYAVLMWSADSTDYAKRISANTLIDKVLRNARPGGMVLMHDGGGDRTKTVKALPQIIDALKKQGYKFVTVPELLAMGDKKESITPKAESHSPENASNSDEQLGEKGNPEKEFAPQIPHENPIP